MSELLLLGGSRVLPPVPTREQVCGIRCLSMNTCPDVVTAQWGTLPYFPPILGAITDAASRQNCYTAARGMGDTHVILGFSTDRRVMYDEPCDIQQVIDPGQETQPDTFLGLVEEAICEGFIPIVPYDGDNGDNVPYGSANALRQLPIVTALLQSSSLGDLTKYTLFARFWDGVFYGTSRENAIIFGQAFRRLLPNGYLAIEHQPGRIPFGEGADDWQPGAVMSDYDVLCHEFNYANDTGPGPDVWQIGARVLGPAYHQPPEDPEPPAPWYLRAGTPRGPWLPVAWEWEGTYWAVRRGTNPGMSTPALEQQRRDYLVRCGWVYTG